MSVILATQETLTQTGSASSRLPNKIGTDNSPTDTRNNAVNMATMRSVRATGKYLAISARVENNLSLSGTNAVSQGN